MNEKKYLWKVDIVLNSGKELECLNESCETDSVKVAEEIFGNKEDTSVVGLLDATMSKNVFVFVREVASFAIYVP